MDYNSRLPR